jgi:hypothetical protein
MRSGSRVDKSGRADGHTDEHGEANWHFSRIEVCPLFTDSVSAVSGIRISPRPEKNWKIKEINGP